MWMDLLFLVSGFALLILGGNWLVRGSVSLSKSIGVSTLLISLTVVAFGTSAPELAVNISAALDGNSGINFGNVIGSNIANIGLVLGLTALVSPIIIHRSVITREIPIMLVASFVALALCMDQTLGIGQVDQISRTDGFILLGVFGLFMIYTFRVAMKQRRSDPFADDVEAEHLEKKLSNTVAIFLLLLGLACVVVGGNLVKDGAVGLARLIGISEAIIGLSVVAVGTSLPELATCIIAVRKGHTDIAIGNAVGSNIWNLLLILAVSAIIAPIVVPKGGMMDLMVMLGLSLLIVPLALTKRSIGRFEGCVLLILYLVYMTYRWTMG